MDVQTCGSKFNLGLCSVGLLSRCGYEDFVKEQRSRFDNLFSRHFNE